MKKANNSILARPYTNSGSLAINTSPQSCRRFGVKPGDVIKNVRQGILGRVVGTAILGRGIYGDKFNLRGKKGLITQKVVWYITDGEKVVRPIKYNGNILKIGFKIVSW